MTVTHSVVGTVKPGRYEDFLAQSLQAAKIYERLGVRNTRLLTAAVAGEDEGSFVWTSEFENMEALGAFFDDLGADADMLSFMTRIRSADNPAPVSRQSVAVEVPLGRPSTARGSVVQVHISRPVPGRLEAGLELANRAFDFVERLGARNPRLAGLTDAGAASGLMVASFEFENMRALGRADDAWASDPEGQAIVATSTGPDAPSMIVSSAIYADIPL